MGGDWASRCVATARACFNPHPRMGGDAILDARQLVELQFQSTPPHGGRHTRVFVSERPLYVSIHTPAWGATPCLSVPLKDASSFNPHPRMGGDSTTSCARWATTSFNPHPRMGGDAATACHLDGKRVSIHTPAWGATHRCTEGGRELPVSIHTPAWGATFLCFKDRAVL